MTEKNLLIIIVVVLVIGAGAIGLFAKFKSVADGTAASPSPSGQDLQFGNGAQASQQPGQQAQQQQQQQAQQGQQKQMKQYSKFPGELSQADLANKKVVIQTAKGNIEFEIYTDAPKAASNFIFLANDHFYDGLTFHRVEAGFVIQGGDPVGNGTGGPGYQFPDEPVTKDYTKGTVAMANSGPNTNGSQFFIMLGDHPELPKQYTIFGKVIAGQDVVDQIQVGDVMQSVTVAALK